MNTLSENLVPVSQSDIDILQLGIDSREFVLETREDVRIVATALARQAQHTLLLHTEDLEPAIFDNPPFLNAASNLARNRRDSCFRILLNNGRKAIQVEHRLIELSRRLSSDIQIRRPAPQYQNYHKTFFLSDDAGFLYRPLSSRYEGIADFNNPGKVSELTRYFMEVWEHSEPDEEMRRLHL
jgi:hypothetical protein